MISKHSKSAFDESESIRILEELLESTREIKTFFSENDRTPNYDGTFERAHNLQIGISPGLTAFVTDFAAVEVSLNVMGFNFKWQDQKTNQIETGKQRITGGNFKIDLFSINIGMTFYL